MACMYVSAPNAHNTHRGKKKVADPLELELQKVVSSHVGAGIANWFLCKSECSNTEPSFQPLANTFLDC